MVDTPFWVVVRPESWPSPPERLSYTVQQEVDGCPRRWALSHADYPGIWAERGYPMPVRAGVASGRVAHRAIESVTNALALAGSDSAADAVPVLRRMGGLSHIIDLEIAAEVAAVRANPRSASRQVWLEDELRRRSAKIKWVVQHALADAVDGGVEPMRPGGSSPERDRGRLRAALPHGFHAEVGLAPADLRWKGTADAIRLTADRCEIFDYKTGQAKSSHGDQLRLYALLWARDAVLNPDRRIATRLAVVYSDHTEEVPAPSELELHALERALEDQEQAVSRALARRPPEARVSVDQCGYCPVRHLCDEYWSGGCPVALGADELRQSVECVITGQRGTWASAATVERSTALAGGTDVLILHAGRPAWTIGSRLRVLDCQVKKSEDGGAVSVRVGPWSEVYALPASI